MLFFISGILNSADQNFKGLAFSYEDASVIAPLQYLQVLFLFVTDLVVFHYSFTFADIIGALIITICILAPDLQKTILVLIKRIRT